MPVKLIAHVLLTVADSHLIIQRSQIKRGKPNVFPQYWDIPGGRVEENELPRDVPLFENALKKLYSFKKPSGKFDHYP